MIDERRDQAQRSTRQAGGTTLEPSVAASARAAAKPTMRRRRILAGIAAVAAVQALVLPLGIHSLTHRGDGLAPVHALIYVKIDNTGDGVEDVAYR